MGRSSICDGINDESNGPAHEILVFNTYMSSRGSDMRAQMFSLARAFAVRKHKVRI